MLSGNNVWKTDYAQSQLQFQTIHAGESFTGDFSRFASAIRLDPQNPEGGKIYVTVDVSSFDAKDDDRNANLPDATWFNIAKFPHAVFESVAIRNVDGSRFVADGTLSLKGISKSVSLTFDLNVNGDTAVAIGETVLLRPDFMLGTESTDFANEDWVAFPVKVLFSITASR